MVYVRIEYRGYVEVGLWESNVMFWLLELFAFVTDIGAFFHFMWKHPVIALVSISALGGLIYYFWW
tara:strand:- start:4415 stop:4612 length:198 start_codon:yes stop_codon:yes gene_type:complete